MSDQPQPPQDLDSRLARLAEDLPPARELWPGIAARIEGPAGSPDRSRTARRWQPRQTWLAAAAVAVAAILVTMVYRGADQAPPVPGGPEMLTAAAFGPTYQLNAGYHAARAGLAQDLEAQLAGLPPETRATVLDNLATIRRAAAEINAALGDDPSNLLLQQQLMAAYQDELAVLANIRRVTERLPHRNEI
jgi:hypothetical protein